MAISPVGSVLEALPGPANGGVEVAIGQSAVMRGLEQALSQVADAPLPVLLVGEDGVGKRLMARRLHQQSVHRHLELERVVCSGLAPGALSLGGAHRDHGPNGGWNAVVVLEEIGDLSLPAQATLLESLQHNSGVRYLATTKKNVEQEVRAGRLREDLVARLGALTLRVPPLRQRKEDVADLIAFFLERFSAQFQRPAPVLSASTRTALCDYNWPGNVRELEAVMGALVVTGNEAMALAAVRWNSNRRAPRVELVPLKEAAREASRHAERDLIMKVLARTRGNRKRAAAELQISYKALLYKLKQIGIDDLGISI